MSSTVSTVHYLQEIELCQVAGAVVVFYDYLLTFGKEVELIWNKKWSFVSLLYLVVRYSSFIILVDSAIYMGNLPLSAKECIALYETRVWGLVIYRVAMDAIMIIRVHAMYNRSRSILIILVTCCVIKTLVVFALLMLSTGPTSGITSVDGNIGGTFICGITPKYGLLMSANIPPLCFEILLVVLAVRCFAIHAREMRQVWKKWRVNALMKILTRDNVLYFVLILTASALNASNWNGNQGFYMAFTAPLVTMIPFVVAPRLVINFRDYFEHADHVHIYTGDIRLDEVSLHDDQPIVFCTGMQNDDDDNPTEHIMMVKQGNNAA